MTGNQLERYRRQSKFTQPFVAGKLGVSQPYLSLLENGKRPVTARLKRKAVKLFDLSLTEMPANIEMFEVRPVSDDQLTADLAALGYSGFSHRKPSRRKNPADVLLSALNSKKRDARLVEALPWVVLQYPDMDWKRLVKTAKAYDLQNRLGFITSLARCVAEFRQDMKTAAKLLRRENDLEHSKLVREETLCNETMTQTERTWLEDQRPDAAKHWHLLTGLSPQHLNYYAS